MYIGNCHEGDIEAEFVFSPLDEMLGALHVLGGQDHHLNRLKWCKEIEEKIEPELLRRIQHLKEKTNEWLIMMDFIQEIIYEDMDVLESIQEIDKLNIVKWNKIFKPYGKSISIQEKEEILDVLRRYYLQCFQNEIKFLQPFIVHRLKKELEVCKKQGIMNYISTIHERIEVQDEVLICHKNKEYRINRSSIHKVWISASTFMGPHLLLGIIDGGLCLTRLIQVEDREKKAPEDLLRVFKALGDNIRLQILREINKEPQSTQGLAKKNKHL